MKKYFGFIFLFANVLFHLPQCTMATVIHVRVQVTITPTLIPFPDSTGSVRMKSPPELKVNLINIPVFVSSGWKGREKCVSALTDSNGMAEVSIFATPADLPAGIVVMANEKPAGCGSSDKVLQEDYISEPERGSTYYIRENDLVRGDRIPDPCEMTVHLTLFMKADPLLLKASQDINNIVPEITEASLPDFRAIESKINSLSGDGSMFALHYPQTSARIKSGLLKILELNKERMAEDAYDNERYSEALNFYEWLSEHFRNSSSIGTYKSRAISCETIIRNENVCDSLTKAGDNIADKSQQIKFFEASLTRISASDPCYGMIQQKIEGLKSDVENANNQAEEVRKQKEDDKALKTFNVDLSVTQPDLFSNAFAFKGKCIAIACTVFKFETPSSAIMDAMNRFYADWKIRPPKRFGALYLIVRVKGVKTLINAYGTPIKVPYVDVIHILNNNPYTSGN